MTHGSTFSGIGGPEVAAAMLGWDNVFHCEINPFGRQILDYYFPNAKSYDDITKTDFSEWRGRIDVLTGGFPCQPFSTAGKRRGAEDDRYLWPYMLKCIDQIRPTWFVGENVAGIASMVLPGETTQMASAATLFDEGDTYEKTEQRYVIEEICRNLESIGYEVQPMLIPACGVGAPHRRDRIFFIAHRVAEDSVNLGLKGGDSVVGHLSGSRHTCAAGGDGQVEFPSPNADLRDDRAESRHNGEEEEEERIQERHDIREPRLTSCLRPKSDGTDADSGCTLLEAGQDRRESCEEMRWSSNRNRGIHSSATPSDTLRTRLGLSHESWSGEGAERMQLWRDCARYHPSYMRHRWDRFPTVSPIYRGNDGIPFPLDSLAISFNKWKSSSLAAYGNAIVPQVILSIFEAIEEVENGSQV